MAMAWAAWRAVIKSLARSMICAHSEAARKNANPCVDVTNARTTAETEHHALCMHTSRMHDQHLRGAKFGEIGSRPKWCHCQRPLTPLCREPRAHDSRGVWGAPGRPPAVREVRRDCAGPITSPDTCIHTHFTAQPAIIAEKADTGCIAEHTHTHIHTPQSSRMRVCDVSQVWRYIWMSGV